MTFLSGLSPKVEIDATCPQGWTVLAASGFSPWKFPMPRYDEMTSTGSHMELSSFRKIGLRDSKLQVLLVSLTREMSIPDFPRISDTRPKWMDGSDQPSGFANYINPNHLPM
jgi:hypothetical protein